MPRPFMTAITSDVRFFQKKYKTALYIAIALICINLGLIGRMYWRSLSVKIPDNFATTSDGRVIKVTPTDT